MAVPVPLGPSSDWSTLELFHFFGPKVFYAIVCGGLIGIERELKNKPAGIKTNILICLGAALYTSISTLMAGTFADSGHFGDPARLAAQIVSGIGFLGGGAIIQAGGTIQGLTTAATIWLVAAIGICIGINHAEIAVVTSLIAVCVLILTNIFEDRVLGRSISFACEIVVSDPEGKVRLAINQALGQNNLLLDDFDVTSQGTDSVLHCRYNGHRADHKKFILDLWSTPGIREVRQI